MRLFSMFLSAVLGLGFLNAAQGLSFSNELANDYQIGSSWGKIRVSKESLEQGSEVYGRAARATAQVGGGTGFYLGKFDGHHVLATNYHVVQSERACKNTRISFPLLGFSGICKELIGSWSDIDAALIIIEARDQFNELGMPEIEARLAKVAQNFRFDLNLYAGQKLLTIGFGSFNNAWRRMVANQDEDCLVFSEEGDYRYIADPDQFNPGGYKVWSFATGCDVSHGDSGSAMVDRDTGEVVGIIWTGKFPKAKATQNSDYLLRVLDEQVEAVIWGELNYGVPAPKIGEYLLALLKNEEASTELQPASRAALEALLRDGGAFE